MTRLLLVLLLVVVARPAAAGGLSFFERVLPAAEGIAVSPDGLNLYATYSADLRVFTRDAATGHLTSLQTVTQGVGGVDGILRSDGVAVSPDGRCVYATSQRADNMATFSRNLATGALTFVDVQAEGVDGVTGFLEPSRVLVSPDGLHVYVGAQLDAIGGSNLSTVVVFRRFFFPSCALTYVYSEDGGSELLGRSVSPGFAISPDGANVYVAGRILQGETIRGGITVLERDAPSGVMTTLQRVVDGVAGVTGLSGVRSIAVSPDGANVYAASGGEIVSFGRSPGSGALTFLDAQRDGGGVIDGLKGVRAVTVAPDGAYVYATSFDDDAVLVFRRDPATGRLRFLEVQKDPDVDPPNDVIAAERNALVAAGNALHVGTTVLAVDTCGNGNRGVDEQCDDGNVAAGDGCSPTCRLERCGPTPSAGCRGGPTGGAALAIRDVAIDKKDRVQWKANGVDATTRADFGEPLTTATYVLCVYDASGNAQPLLASAAPSGGLCYKGTPCWSAKTSEYRYKDKLLTPDGIEAVRLREGLVDGETKLQVKAKGINLVPPTLPLTLPVTVQLKNTATGVCWEAVYGTAAKNDASQFKAKSD